jgi:hypothetical protein
MQTSGAGKPYAAVVLGLLIALPVALPALAARGFANLVQSESSPAPQDSATMPSLTGLRPGTKMVAELQSTLDVLAVKSGDEITARVTKNLKHGGRIIVHEGDRLVGRVTRVQPQSVGQGRDDSELAIAFDRLASGAYTYRLNTVIHSVVWIPSHVRGGEAVGIGETHPNSEGRMPLRGPRPLSGDRGVAGSDGGAGRAGEKTTISGGDPREGAAPPGSIKARSHPAPDGHAGAVSVLSDHQGNLRLRAGTRLDFRTQ